MRLPVLTAVPDPRWESELVAAFERAELGVAVVRRCIDLPDLLATAATGTARAVVLAADLRRLDRDALARLRLARVAVVGLVAPGDEDGDRRLRRLGVRFVLAADAAPEVVAQALTEAVASAGDDPQPGHAGYADPLAGLPDASPATASGPAVVPGTGRVLAVWGPAGAPGRTTVAVNLAAELAALGLATLLADADVYGGAVAPALGLLDEGSGIAAACRQANSGTLDVASLGALARRVGPRLRVLTGLARASRWPELRPAALEAVLALGRTLADVVVVDTAFCIERDDELAYDTAVQRRNGATLTVLDAADTVVVVATADPIGIMRTVHALAELREIVPGVTPTVVVNRLRRSALGLDPRRQVLAALDRFADVDRVVTLPYDRAGADTALRLGQTLGEAAPGSALRAALAGLAAELAGVSRPARRRRRRLPAVRLSAGAS